MSKTVSPLTKFYRWKYSGLIVVSGIVVIILAGWFYYTSTLEFFDTWSCEGLIDYVMTDKDLGVPKHNELTEKQHLHLHEILQPCMDDFTPQNIHS